MQFIWAFVGFILTLLTYYAFKFYEESSHYKRQGIVYLGNGLSRVVYKSLKSLNHCDYLQEQYSRVKRARKKFGVGSEFSAKTYFITDLLLIKDIFFKKFDHFVDRRCVVSESDLFIPKMLMTKQGDDWKDVRAKLNHAFTSTRLSAMFPLMDKSSQKLVKYFETQVDSPFSDVETGISKFTMDAIASLAFGVESEAFENPEKRSTFEQMAAQLPGSLSLSNILKLSFLHLCPRLGRLLKLSLYSKEAQRYFEKSLKDTISQRIEGANPSHSETPDFLQLMLQLRSTGLPIEESHGESEKTSISFTKKPDSRTRSRKLVQCDLTDEDIVAHSISFILGGYEHTVSLQLFTLYNLATHEEVQEEVYKEIRDVLEKSGSQEVTYDVVNKLELLSSFLYETLRLHPPAASTDRMCTKDYEIAGSDVIIQKGDAIEIPVFAVHTDEAHFPDPCKFDINRFLSKNKTTSDIHSSTFMAFGQGPRSCIGMKLSLLLIKLALVRILLSYKIQTSNKTPVKLSLAMSKMILPGERMFLKLSQRK